MVDSLTGKVALITGGARGIGRATAELFTREGAAVISGDVLDAEDVGATSVEFLRLEVTKDHQWKCAIDGIVAKHGKIDVLVNNAAICLYEPILETTEAMWDKVRDIDLKSIFFGMREAAGRHSLQLTPSRSMDESCPGSACSGRGMTSTPDFQSGRI